MFRSIFKYIFILVNFIGLTSLCIIWNYLDHYKISLFGFYISVYLLYFVWLCLLCLYCYSFIAKSVLFCIIFSVFSVSLTYGVYIFYMNNWFVEIYLYYSKYLTIERIYSYQELEGYVENWLREQGHFNGLNKGLRALVIESSGSLVCLKDKLANYTFPINSYYDEIVEMLWSLELLDSVPMLEFLIDFTMLCEAIVYLYYHRY